MLITKNLSTCKSASTKLLNPVDIGSGNIIPNWWYSTILTTAGKADTTAIALLSELWFLYRSTGQEEHQKDYDYFGNKFNLSQFQIREAFIRLEAIDLMHRSIGSIVVQGRKFANILFVTLHVKQLFEMSPKVCKSSTKDDDNDPNEEIFFDNRVSDPEEIESEILKANKIKKNLEEDRSTESNINSNSFLQKQDLPISVVAYKQRFSLVSFYPLVQSDIDNLQHLCGREFSGNAINEILQNLSIKLPNHTFPHKAAFIKYMGKVLTYEMRDAVKISNESFKIKSNVTSEEITAKAREEFLNKIENSRDTSPKMQLRRKLAGILEPSIAYDFLMSASFLDNTESLKTDSFKIILRKKLTLSQSQHRLILAQVQSVYGDHINSLNITSSQDTETTDTSFKQPHALQKEETKSFEGIWGKIRQGLIDYYGSGGNAMDNAWFSKLIANIDADNKKLTLKAPTKFIKDWVQSNYSYLIDKLCSLHDYSLEGVLAV